KNLTGITSISSTNLKTAKTLTIVFSDNESRNSSGGHLLKRCSIEFYDSTNYIKVLALLLTLVNPFL
ncbi:MAG: hypothetical protein ACQEQU_07035, partial [Spirochaetota bacterium]